MPVSLPDTPRLLISSCDEMMSHASPEWKNNNYNLSALDGKIEKIRIEVCEGLFLERLSMQKGALRTFGILAEGYLCLSQFVSGRGAINGVDDHRKLCSVAYGHSRQETIARESVQITSIIFGGDAIKQNFANSTLARLEGRSRRKPGGDALMRIPCDHSETLFGTVDQYISAVTRSGRLDEFKSQTRAFIDEMQPVSAALVECMMTSDPIRLENGAMFRRELALEIERALWSFQSAGQENALPETMARQLGVSVRYVQLAVKEHFGVSYSMLVRIVRLHQVRESLRIKTRYKKISDIAAQHGFAHSGRFSQYYKRLFGVSPRETDQG